MKNRIAKTISIGLGLVLIPALMAGCTAGVSQGKYDQLVAERHALKTQVTKLESELATVKGVKPIPSAKSAETNELTHEIEGTVENVNDDITEIAMLRRGPEEDYKVKVPKVAGRILGRAQKIEHARSKLHKLTEGLKGEHLEGLHKLTVEYKKAVDKLLAMARQLEELTKEPLKNKEKIREIEASIHYHIEAVHEGKAVRMAKYDELAFKLPEEVVWEYTEVIYPVAVQRLENGNTLIVDGGCDNSRVIEVTPDKKIVWDYAAMSFSARRLPNGNTLIAELAPLYWDPCRVIEVTPDKKIVWEYTGDFVPSGVDRLPNGNTVITDPKYHRILEVTPDKEIVWEYTDLIYAWGVECLPNGNILTIETRDTKHMTHTRLLEITRAEEVVWEYPYIDAPYGSFKRLPNGNTLISDTDRNRKKNPRVIEVTPDKKIVWEYATDLIFPSSVRLPNGNTLIADCGWPRVIEVAAP